MAEMQTCCPTCGQPYQGNGGQLSCGPYKLDWASNAVFLHGERIILSRGEYEILKMLFHRPGAVVKAVDLEKAVWGRELAPRQYSLKTVVCRLRSKLVMEENGVMIIAVYKIGYRIAVPVNFG